MPPSAISSSPSSQNALENNFNSTPSFKRIKIPDIFESFMSRPPTVNPLYESVRDEALEWANKMCHYSPKEADRMRRGDFAFFAAISVPDAAKYTLRTVTDWLNWVFVFDDQLDDGPLGQRSKSDEAIRYIDSMIAVLDEVEDFGSYVATQDLRNVLKDIWERVKTNDACSYGAKMRWRKYMKQYLNALRVSIFFEPSDTVEETIQSYFDYRFNSIGVLPLFTFVEYSTGIQIPDYVFDDDSMLKLQRIGVEIQEMFANDCVSYHREKDNSCPHNVIHLLRHHGLSEQGAYDYAHDLLRKRYREWYIAHSTLPVWGEEIDQSVYRYIKGIQDVALANAHWSFRTERYFGKHRDQVRKTREVPVGRVDWLPAILLPEN